MVRIFNTYGPHMNPEDSRVIPHFMRQAEKNERLNLHGDGFQTRSFCYVDDLVDQLWVYAKSSISQPMNLGHDQEVSILTVGQMILQLFDRPLDLLTFESQMPDEPHRRCPHLEFMRSQKENIIQIDLNEGLHKTARWWKDLKLREARA